MVVRYKTLTAKYKLTISGGIEKVIEGSQALYVWEQLLEDSLVIYNEDGTQEVIGTRYRNCICNAKLEVTYENGKVTEDEITICITPEGTIITDVPAGGSAGKGDGK